MSVDSRLDPRSSLLEPQSLVEELGLVITDLNMYDGLGDGFPGFGGLELAPSSRRRT